MNTPQQYRKKPVVVWAIQFVGTNFDEVDRFVGGRPAITWKNTPFLGGWISTLEGEMEFVEGDFIIQGVKGEYYPCKPDIFEMSYEEDAP